MKPSLISPLMFAAGAAGLLGGGALIGRWCLGLMMILMSAALVYVGLTREEESPAMQEARHTVEDVLANERAMEMSMSYEEATAGWTR